MAQAYTVRARIVDLKDHRPSRGESYLIDTNVLWWASYPFAPETPSPPRYYQTEDYPEFLKAAKVAGAQLHWSPLSWPELAHHIERTEFAVAKYYGAPNTDHLKAYRHGDAQERERVVQAIEDAWGMVESLATPLPIAALDQAAVNQARSGLKTCGVDGYDLFLVDSVRASGITGIITDDGDFCTVPGITVFTANRSMLSAAQR